MSEIENVEEQLNLNKIREEILKSFNQYRKTISFLSADAPIEILCLPKGLENILISNDFLRVYDLFNLDFTKIKGIGIYRSRYLATRLDQFIAML